MASELRSGALCVAVELLRRVGPNGKEFLSFQYFGIKQLLWCWVLKMEADPVRFRMKGDRDNAQCPRLKINTVPAGWVGMVLSNNQEY